MKRLHHLKSNLSDPLPPQASFTTNPPQQIFLKTALNYIRVWRRLYHNLEYGDTKSGQLRYMLMKKIFFICIQSKKFKKRTYVEIQNDFQNMFNFYDSFYDSLVKGLYWCSLWWQLPWKNNYNTNNSQSFQARTLNPVRRINFCEFYPLDLNS